MPYSATMRLLRDAECAREPRVELAALDDPRAPLESAGLHDARARRRRERKAPLAERVDERDRGERGRRDADRLPFGDRRRERARETVDVERERRPRGRLVVEEPARVAVAAHDADVPHHIAER